MATGQRGDQARILNRTFGRPVEFAFEIGIDLEQRQEIRVEFRQQVIDDPLADQDHLEVERDRFRFELHRAAQADQFGQRFDPYLAGLQGALEAFPGVRLGKDLLRIEDQESAIGAMQRARLDQCEIADQGAHVHVMFDAPDQILQGRIVLIDHRPIAAARVVDQQIDQIALHRDGAGKIRGFRFIVALGRFVERLAAFEDVLHDLLEISGDRRQIVVAGLDFLDQVTYCQPQRLAADFLDDVLHIPAPARKLVHQLVQFFVAGADLLAEFLLSLFRQLGELLVRIGFLGTLHRREDEALRRPQQGNAGLLGVIAELAQGVLLAMLLFFLQRLDAFAILLAVERRRDRRADFPDEALHVVAQLQPPAAGQLQQARPRRIGEIIDITPVDRRRPLVPFALQQTSDDGMAPAARFAEHEQAVTLVRHFETEVDRRDGARMNQCRIEVDQAIGRGKP